MSVESGTSERRVITVVKSNSDRLAKRLVALVGTLAGLTLVGLPAASAQAALINTATCNTATLSQPFSAWDDTNSYELVPGGDFEGSLAGWTLSGGAHVVTGSEPFGASGSVGSGSLALPAGASAQTPTTCVDAAYPTFRFFAKNLDLTSSVLVQIVYTNQTLLGSTQVVVPVGVATRSSTWQPTLPMLTASPVLGLLSGGTAEVALRFTALGGESQIDDIYLDPRQAK
jgi:hypothetical protein